MIKKLAFYDFDGTLMDTPMPDVGRIIWRKKTGEEYPHEGWWGRKESIDTDVFDIKPFKTIQSQLINDNNDPETYTVMLTSRLKKLEPYIDIVLSKNGISFDDKSFKDGSNLEKDVRIKEYLKSFPNVETIDIYDDREKEMIVFRRLINEIGDSYQINLYRADKGKFALVESIDINRLITDIILEEFGVYKKT